MYHTSGRVNTFMNTSCRSLKPKFDEFSYRRGSFFFLIAFIFFFLPPFLLVKKYEGTRSDTLNKICVDECIIIVDGSKFKISNHEKIL